MADYPYINMEGFLTDSHEVIIIRENTAILGCDRKFL
jgi:hypothetical protein